MCERNREFEKHAFGLLENLYEIDQDRTRHLVRKPLCSHRSLGSSSSAKPICVLELVDNLGLEELKTHDCYQNTLDSIWQGGIATKTSVLQVRSRYVLP